MKFLSTVLTALVLVGFAGAASAACSDAQADTAQAPVVVPQGGTDS